MKTTRKEIYRIYGKENVILLGYCEIQYMHHLGRKTKMCAKCANGGKNCIIITILVNAKK